MNLDATITDVRRGMIPASIYSDPAIFALERERLFAAHVAVPRPRVRDPPAGRLRRAPDRRRLVHRRRATTRRRGPRAAQHVPAPRHAGVPGRGRHRVALPLPLSRVDLPQRRPARRRAVPPGGVRRRRRLRQGRPRAAARPHVGTYHGLVFANLDPTRRRSRSARRLPVLPRPLRPPERRRRRVARPAAVAGRAQLEDRRRELRRRLVPHASHPRERRRHRAVPRAEGEQAQGRRAVLRRRGRRHHLQAPAAATSSKPGLRGLSAGDGRAHEGGVERAQQALVGEAGFMVSAATMFPNLSFVHNWPKIPTTATTSCRSSRCGCGSRSSATRPNACRGSPSTATRRRRSRTTRTRPT